jgi:hypothetical protein
MFPMLLKPVFHRSFLTLISLGDLLHPTGSMTKPDGPHPQGSGIVFLGVVI